MEMLSGYAGPVEFLRECFDIAVATADPNLQVKKHLPKLPSGRVLVVGAGKAAASMASSVEKEWGSKTDLSGIVITRYEHGLPLSFIECLEAGHPVPDEAGQEGAKKIFELIKKLNEEDLLVVLVSGGGSSLLTLPVDGISVSDIKKVTKDLLVSGAPITDINTVRKHLSKIQGGRMALASKAPVYALIVSDVVGDSPSDIASGPCVGDPTTFLDAKKVLTRWKINPPERVSAFIDGGVNGDIEDTPKPGDPRLSHSRNSIIATARLCLSAVGEFARKKGIHSLSMGDAITGEARDVGEVMAAWAREITLFNESGVKKPLLLLSGGECTVTVTGNGRGGRCAEFLLSVALKLETLSFKNKIYGLAADTDGIDGVSPHAGVVMDPTSIRRVRELGVDPLVCLENNDALGVFEPLKQVITTGPTRTNVNDFRALLIL